VGGGGCSFLDACCIIFVCMLFGLHLAWDSVCVGMYIDMCLCMCDRERDMPFEVTLVAQRVKVALPVGLS
jgi:hypothetical protein